MALSKVTPLALSATKLEWDVPIIVNDAALSLQSYSLREWVDYSDLTAGTAVNLRRLIIPSNTGQITECILVHDKLEDGQDYIVSSPQVVDATNSSSDDIAVVFRAYIHKVEAALSNIPDHYARAIGTEVRTLLQAITNQDDIIGGNSSRNELIVIEEES